MKLDFDKYPILGKAPQTLFEHFRADPRGADSYPKWIEDRIWELLQRRSILGVFNPRTFHHYNPGAGQPAWQNMLNGISHVKEREHVRLWLSDGTTIKEWPGNNNAEMA